MQAPTREKLKQLAARLLLLILSPLLLVLILFFVIAYCSYATALHICFWLLWSPAGKRVLFVYSNSPVWQHYVEERILPRLPHGSVILNWSDRRRWNKLSLPYAAFVFYGGRRAYNPIAIVVRPFRLTRTFRFWRAFRDFKHGKTDSLEKIEKEFFGCLEATGRHV